MGEGSTLGGSLGRKPREGRLWKARGTYSHATALPPPDAEQVLEDDATLLTLARPEVVPLPDAHDVAQARSLICHTADVPILLSAMQSRPNWLLTHNTAHFTPSIATRTGLQIATPRAFFQALARGLR